MIDAERDAWERQRRESSRAYEAFRMFRDLGPLRTVAAVEIDGVSRATIRRWASERAWVARARAWDDHVYRQADAARLDAVREMHRSHQIAGRAAMSKALAALQHLQPADINAAAAVRLLDVGTRLERSTLASTLAQLQGVDQADEVVAVDPWEAIARELQGSTAALRHASSS